MIIFITKGEAVTKGPFCSCFPKRLSHNLKKRREKSCIPQTGNCALERLLQGQEKLHSSSPVLIIRNKALNFRVGANSNRELQHLDSNFIEKNETLPF
ncbi:hypothetical protein NPIL_299071 [Nephila pilipes]|uniref:Uncharacterized protein n=1 Tax=Nephila pilipes TaxID=299642 RepID=A0A8X6T2I5_NEPPI|nr:hypothetical protein NPIL_299071 [Nephila pilipes]